MITLRSWCTLVLLYMAGALVLVPVSQAQQFETINFCTLYQQSPQTEDARSTLTEEWDPEDSAWSSELRTIISYDGSNPTEVVIQERGQSGAWRDTARAVGSYDGSRLTQCVIEQRQGGAYVNSFRTDFSYNADDRVDTETSMVWDTTAANPDGAWINAIRSTYSYDSGNVTERVDQSWDRSSESWIDNQRVQNTYDSSDRLIEELRQISGGGGQWLNQQKTTNTYSSDGITESLVESWAGMDWQEEERTQYMYPSGDTREEIDQEWDGDWVNVEKRTITLNSNDFLATEVSEEWTGSEWAPSGRTELTYTTHDGTQKIEQILNQTWDGSAGDWLNSDRTRISYTEVIPVELAWFEAQTDAGRVVLHWQTASETSNAGFDVQHRSSADDTWQRLAFLESKAAGGTTAEPQSYRYRTDELDPGTHRFRLRQVDLDGSATLTDPITVELQLENPLHVDAPAPNPVSNRAVLSFGVQTRAEVQVTLYNVLGQQVGILYEGTPSAGEKKTVPINAQALSSGTYILRLQAEGQTRTERFTVVK